MKARKWSVKYVSDRSGVSRQTIYALMRGEHPPSPDTQRGLAEALEVESDWADRLLAGQEPLEVSPRAVEPSIDPTRLAALEAQVDGLTRVVLELGQITRARLGEHVELVEALATLAELEGQRVRPPAR